MVDIPLLRDALQELKDHGANRQSVGVQSLMASISYSPIMVELVEEVFPAGQPPNRPHRGEALTMAADNEITCGTCGHTEWWESGNYFGERTDMAHHVCGKPGRYEPCGPDCAHTFPGSGAPQPVER